VEIAAERFVEADSEAVSAFLWDLENHWLLADRFVELVSLEPRAGVGDRGTVRLRGPVSLRRTASTRVLAVSPGQLLGSAEIGRRTRARLRWTLSPRQNGTAVRLSATVLKLVLSDRLLLAIGGERWLRGRFDATIARLAEHVGQQAVAPPAAPRRPPQDCGAAAPGAAASCRGFLTRVGPRVARRPARRWPCRATDIYLDGAVVERSGRTP
jgi:hypothetical protein